MTLHYNKEKALVLNKFFSSENTENVPEIRDRQFESGLDNITTSPEEFLKRLYNLNQNARFDQTFFYIHEQRNVSPPL